IATACNDPGETSVVNQATPVLTTVATPTALVGDRKSKRPNSGHGVSTHGGFSSFKIYGPNDATCGSAAIFTNTKAVVSSGGGTGTATSDLFTLNRAGTHRWLPSFPTRRSSDLIATACNDPGETSVVNQATPVLTTVATPTALV